MAVKPEKEESIVTFHNLQSSNLIKPRPYILNPFERGAFQTAPVCLHTRYGH